MPQPCAHASLNYEAKVWSSSAFLEAGLNGQACAIQPTHPQHYPCLSNPCHPSPTTANLCKCVLRGVSTAAAFETFNKAPACSYIMDCTQLVSLRNSSGEGPASQVSAKAKSNGSHKHFWKSILLPSQPRPLVRRSGKSMKGVGITSMCKF